MTIEDQPKVSPLIVGAEVAEATMISEADRLSSWSRRSGFGFQNRTWANAEAVYNPLNDDIENVDVGFLEGTKHSWFSQMLQMELSDENFLGGKQYMPESKEEIMEILRKVDYNMDRYHSVLNGANTKEDVDNRIKINQEHIEYRLAESKANFMDAMFSGFGSAVTDPLTYTPMGAYGLAGRVAVGAVSGALSNQLETYVSGTESDLLTDIAVGATMGLGFELAFKGLGYSGTFVGDTARRAQLLQQASLAGQDLPSEALEGLKGSQALASKLNNFRQKLESKLPVVSLQGIQNKAQTQELKGILGTLIRDYGEGFEDSTGTRVAIASSKPVAVEMARDAHIRWQEFDKAFNDDYEHLLKAGYSEDEINRALMLDIEYDVQSSLTRTPEFVELKAKYTKLMEDDGFPNMDSSHYMSRVIHPEKVADTLDEIYGVKTSYKNAVSDYVEKTLDAQIQDYYTNPQIQKVYQDHYINYEYAKLRQADPTLPQKPSKAEMDAYVEKKLKETVYGWIDHNESDYQNFLSPRNIRTSSSKFDPYRERFPINTNVKNAYGKTLNDIRLAPFEAARMYHFRRSGDNIVEAMGYKDSEALREALAKAVEAERQNAIQGLTKKELSNVVDTVLDMIYNKQGAYSRENFEGASAYFQAATEVLRNLTMFSYDALMSIANLFEVAEAIKQFGVSQFFRGIPAMNNIMTKMTKDGYTEQEMQQALVATFGLSSMPDGTFREIRRQSWDRQMARYNGNKALAVCVGFSDVLMRASPFTRAISATENSIVSASQRMFLGALIQHVHTGATFKGEKFLSKETLYRNSIDEADWDHLKTVLKSCSSIDSKGRIQYDSKGLLNDRQALSTMRRLGDYIANEVIQKKNLDEAYLWAGSNKNPFLSLIFQFKNFAVQSYKKKLAKSMNRAAEGDALGQAYTVMLHTALGTLNAMVNSTIATAGMNEEQRANYMKRNYGYTEENGVDAEVLTNIAKAGLNRAPIFALPSLVAAAVGSDISRGAKTTGNIDYTSGESERLARSRGFDLDTFASALFPSYNVLRGYYNVGAFGFDTVVRTGDQYSEYEMEKDRERFARAVRGLTNIPFLKWGSYNILTDKD